MSKEEFINLLQKAEEDEYGNLYIKEGCFTNEEDLFFEDMKDKKWYFTLTNTVCDDFIKGYCSQDSKNNFEHYNRHFINDDTIEIKVINNGNPKKCEEFEM